jgi:hypothetical protein
MSRWWWVYELWGQGEAEGGIKESARRRGTGGRERFPSPLVDPQSNV